MLTFVNSSVSQGYSITVHLEPSTLSKLKNSGYKLYVLKAIKSYNRSGKSLVWSKIEQYHRKIKINWDESVSIYIMSKDTVTGIQSMDSKPLEQNQYVLVQNGIISTMISKKKSNRLSIFNSDTQEYFWGIENNIGHGKNAPVCEFKLYGKTTDFVMLEQFIFLMFSSEDLDIGEALLHNNNTGVLIGLDATHHVNLYYYVNKGWDWGGYSWGKIIQPYSTLSDYLIVR